MAIVTETITVTIAAGSANAQSFTFPAQVDTTTGATPAGSPSPTFTFQGKNAGTDTITCAMTSHSLTSNSATVVWQAINGPIAVNITQIDSYANVGKRRGWAGFNTGAGSFGNVYPYKDAAHGANSLVLNQVARNGSGGTPITGTPCFPNNASNCGGYKMCPTIVVNQTATGVYSSSIPISGTSDGAGGNADNGSDHAAFVLDIYGNLVVGTAGTYTFYGVEADKSSYCMWINGLSASNVSSQTSGQSNNGGNPNYADGNTTAFNATSPKFGYSPIAVVCTNNAAPLIPPASSAYVTFPKAGIYPFELVYNQWAFTQFSGDDNSYMQITYLSGTQNQNVGNGYQNIGTQFLPVALAAAPPAGTTPTGNLKLTPVGGATNLKVQGQTVTLTLSISGVTYKSIPYCPILEGTAGSMFVYNSGTSFNFQTYNGHAVDTTAAASDAFSISGSNTSGLFSITATGAPPSPFKFNYNGDAFSFITPSTTVSSTTATVTADDIAWFDPTGTKFDIFNGGAGSVSYTIDVDFMTKPTVSSVSGGPLKANGQPQSIQINLTKPMSPMQQGLYGTGNTLSISGSCPGATLGATFTPVLNSGFLTGWTNTITPAQASVNGSLTLSLTISGTLTYLSGTSFVNGGAITYVNGPVATIQTIGYPYPVGTALSTSPSSSTLSSTSATTITGTEYTFDNPGAAGCTVQFWYKYTSSTGTKINIGSPTSSAINPQTISVGGKTAYQKQYQISYTFPKITIVEPGESIANADIYLGFTVTDNFTGLSADYQSTTVYTLPYTIIVVRTGGCPAVEMWLDDRHQVCDVYAGMELSCVDENTIEEYSHGVEKFNFDVASCYRIATANGAEVVVSSTTPVPVRGNMVPAPTAADVESGQFVVTDIGNGLEWSEIVEVECVGMRHVARISLGGRIFAAGSVRGKYIYTHNVIKP